MLNKSIFESRAETETNAKQMTPKIQIIPLIFRNSIFQRQFSYCFCSIQRSITRSIRLYQQSNIFHKQAAARAAS